MDISTYRRSVVLCLALVAGLSVLSGRLVYLQVLKRQTYQEKAKSSYTRKYTLKARRGLILDRNLEAMAVNLPSNNLMVDKYHLKDPRMAAYGLACKELREEGEWHLWTEKKKRAKVMNRRRQILEENTPTEIVQKHLDYAIEEIRRPLGLTTAELKEKIDLNKKPMDVVLMKDILEGDAERLRALMDSRRIQGFRFEEVEKRWYNSPLLATHLTGYVDHKGRGRSGLESAMDDYLAGRDGHVTVKRDNRGQILPAHKGSTLTPKNGLNVQLTIDMGLQQICEEELDWGMKEFQGVKGSVVLMDPKTGEILAMASRPHYNLNNREDVAKNGYSFSHQAKYEPGSTIKIVAIAGALNEGAVKLDDQIFCHNKHYREGKIWVSDYKPFGYLPIWKIIQKSSNIGTYLCAKKIGKERFFEYVKAFGFGQKTGVRLAGENRGEFIDTGNEMDFSRQTFGYASAVTPLQVASAYSVIANGGLLMKPHIVKQVETAKSGMTVEKFEPKVIRRVISEKTARDMRYALSTVTQKGGTATGAAVPGYVAAGKTGTGRKYIPNVGYAKDRYFCSFAGMLPAENPAFVCVVVIDDPQTTEVKRYGGKVAAPIWQRVCARAATHMNLTPELPVESSSTAMTQN